MESGTSHRRLRRGALICGLALSCAAPTAAAARPAPQDAPLSPRLAELARPAVRSLPLARQSSALGVAPRGASSLLRRGNRVLVDVRFDSGAEASLDPLRGAGAQVIHLSRRYQTVTVAVPPASLHALAKVAGVEAVTEDLAPVTRADGNSPTAAVSACAGTATSEGDFQLHAGTARADFNVDGAGTTVGIISDSFDRDASAPTDAARDVASGDLPGPGNPCGRTTPVRLLDDSYAPASDLDPDDTDEGRAMAQIVHDLAPGAALEFATGFTGLLAFADNVRALHAAGAQVIADDVSYLNEPVFQDGPVGAAISDVTNGGSLYFTAAGNDNVKDDAGANIGSWQTPSFRGSGSCPAGVPNYGTIPNPPGPDAVDDYDCLDFNPDPGITDRTFGVTVRAGATLIADLQWAQPWYGVQSDLDMYLLDSSGDPVTVDSGDGPVAVTSEEDNVNLSQQPVEVLAWQNTTGSDQQVSLAVKRFTGPTDMPVKLMLLHNSGDGGFASTEYPSSAGGDVVGPMIYGHSAAPEAVTTGAIRFNSGTEPETFSSRGPAIHYYGQVRGTSPAGALASPVTVSKPDLLATDCGVTTFFLPTGIPGVYRFCGTSAAAPHAAAVAALLRQANPTAGPAQIRNALAATAVPLAGYGAAAAGAGLIDAYEAVGRIALPPTVSIAQAPPPLSNDPTPTFGFLASRPVVFACSLDGQPPQSCTSPYTSPARLGDGEHRFQVSGTGIGGQVGSSDVITFAIDTTPPQTKLVKRPKKKVRTKRKRVKVTFRFRASEPATFVCKLDRKPYRACAQKLVRRLKKGRHTFRVRATDAAGNVEPTPAVFRFKVKSKRKRHGSHAGKGRRGKNHSRHRARTSHLRVSRRRY